jgi:hypothetical protein
MPEEIDFVRQAEERSVWDIRYRGAFRRSVPVTTMRRVSGRLPL